MKRSLIFFAAVAICAASCGTAGEFSESDRFQDGIYYKPNPRMSGREPLSEENFRYMARMDNFRREADSLSVLRDTVYVALEDPYSLHPYSYWRPYTWSYYSYWGYYPRYGGYYSPYWGYSPYYWGSPYYYSWGYDPYWWDYDWYYGYPYYGGYYGYPYHRPYYGYHHSGTYMRRTGSATSGHYSRPAHQVISGGRVASASGRSASAMAQRDLDRIKVQRSGHKTTAVNREGYSETRNYRTTSATRASSGASYNSTRDYNSSTRYESSSSTRSVSSSRSSGYSGGGHSSSSSHSSHSSGGGGYHGGGHR
ncbi:MAG: hypothetical protein J5740_04955 [Bacteroidales bacterium]|nr:hypothetical protein [Bacteroidales bacterium]